MMVVKTGIKLVKHIETMINPLAVIQMVVKIGIKTFLGRCQLTLH